MTYVNRDYEGHFRHLLSASSMLFPAPQSPFPNSKITLPNSIYARIFVRFSSIFATFMADSCVRFSYLFTPSSRIQAATLLCMRCLKAVLKVL